MDIGGHTGPAFVEAALVASLQRCRSNTMS